MCNCRYTTIYLYNFVWRKQIRNNRMHASKKKEKKKRERENEKERILYAKDEVGWRKSRYFSSTSTVSTSGVKMCSFAVFPPTTVITLNSSSTARPYQHPVPKRRTGNFARCTTRLRWFTTTVDQCKKINVMVDSVHFLPTKKSSRRPRQLEDDQHTYFWFQIFKM